MHGPLVVWATQVAQISIDCVHPTVFVNRGIAVPGIRRAVHRAMAVPPVQRLLIDAEGNYA